MSKKVLFTLLLLPVFLVSGCRPVPAEVQERIEEYGDNHQINEEAELKYCTVEELSKVNIKDISDKYNVKVPDNFDCADISELGILDIQQETGWFERKDEFIKFFDVNESKLNYRKADDTGLYFIYECDDKKERKYFSLDDNGMITYLTDMSYEVGKDEEMVIDTYATYNTYCDDISGETIDFDGEEVPLNDVADNSVAWMQEHFPTEGMDYGITDIYARKLKSDDRSTSQLTLLMGLYYKGVLVEPYVKDWDDDEDGESFQKAAAWFSKFNYEGRDKLTFAAVYKSQLNNAEPVDKVITPECAFEIINNTFSGFKKIEASDFRILYGLFPDNENAMSYEGRPVYAFWINKENNGITDFGINILPEHYIYVDMITGEITTSYEI